MIAYIFVEYSIVKPNTDEMIKIFSIQGTICLYLNAIASTMAKMPVEVTNTGMYGAPNPIEPQKQNRC